MSNIAFFSIPAWGHVNPTVAVVEALVRRGHQVKYWSFASFREKLEEAGAEVICCDQALPPAPKDLDKKVGRDFAALVEMAADTTLALEDQVLAELTQWKPEVIVADSVCFWGKLFAQRLGVPWVCSTTTFAFTQTTAKGMKPSAGELARMVLGMPRVNKKLSLLRDHGYPVGQIQDLVANDDKTDTLVYTSRVFQPEGEGFSDRYAFVGPTLPLDLTRGAKESDQPLVYVALGSVLRGNRGFFRRVVQALAGLPGQVILATGGEDIGPLPPNCTALDWADQREILAQADVFLTHCGMNSVSEALWLGVPTVLFPQQSEEGVVADRLEELGAGLRPKNQRPQAIRAAVETALRDPSYREKARALGETLREAGGAERAAEFILSRCK
jgi:MGT family glycosyltransferase